MPCISGIASCGIPVGIGIAPTKTLAKIANHRAKKSASPVCILLSDEEIAMALKETPVGEIWGIGKQYAGFLNRHGVISAFDLTRMPDNWVKKNLTVVGLRTKKELAGISCLSLEEIAPSRKAICTSRSFGRSQTELTQLEEAVATFAVRCAEKLRSQGSAASEIMVFIHTNAFRTDLPQYARNRVINIPAPTNDSLELVKLAVGALRSIFHKGYDYKKAGVIVTGLVPDREIQQELFGSATGTQQRTLMESIDEINRKMGHQAVRIATQGIERKWRLRQEKLSPAYTTRWNEILEIKL